jgi:hypothetical protein
MALTGRFTFRRSFGGRIILQVEEQKRTVWPFSRRTPSRKRWRDASLMDLAAPELRALIDLRFKPQFMPQYDYSAAEPSHQAVPAESHDPRRPLHPVPDPASPDHRTRPVVAVEVERAEEGPGLKRLGDAA